MEMEVKWDRNLIIKATSRGTKTDVPTLEWGTDLLSKRTKIEDSKQKLPRESSSKRTVGTEENLTSGKELTGNESWFARKIIASKNRIRTKTRSTQKKTLETGPITETNRAENQTKSHSQTRSKMIFFS
jgi:hypothetical protein